METQSLSKGRKIASWVLIGLLSAMLMMSAIMKLMSGPDSDMGKMAAMMGYDGWMKAIAVGELISAILFLIPRTSSLGVLLLSAHLGGAIATHLTHGDKFVVQTVLLLLVWVANYLRNPEMLASFFRK
jgi:sugar phosphate permease